MPALLAVGLWTAFYLGYALAEPDAPWPVLVGLWLAGALALALPVWLVTALARLLSRHRLSRAS